MGEQLSLKNRRLIDAALGCGKLFKDHEMHLNSEEIETLLNAARAEGSPTGESSGEWKPCVVRDLRCDGEHHKVWDGHDPYLAKCPRPDPHLKAARAILGEFCACYAEAWPAKSCDGEARKLAATLRTTALSASPPPPKGAGQKDGSSQGLGGHPCGERVEAETERVATLAGDAVGVIRRLVFRLEDLLEIARQWEPDHASAEHRAELFFAKEARTAAYEFLSSGRYRQAGTGETFRDQPRLAELSDGASSRPTGQLRDEPISCSPKGEAVPVVSEEMVVAAARAFSGAPFPSHRSIEKARTALAAALSISRPASDKGEEPGTDWSEHEDDISDAISDSIDMDWTSRDGAKAVIWFLNTLSKNKGPAQC